MNINMSQYNSKANKVAGQAKHDARMAHENLKFSAYLQAQTSNLGQLTKDVFEKAIK